jgi:predicted subunit of tRNA(5-methylaminomethyl-2-thiouridylate) methyltransferase
MIRSNLMAEFENRIAQLDATIAENRAALDVEEDDPGQSMLLRVRIKSLETLKQTLKKSLTDVTVAEARVPDMEARFIRWRALCAEARTAQDEMDAIATQVGATREAVIPVANAAFAAEAELERHRAKPMSRFPTAPEVRRHKETEETLLQKYDALGAKTRELAVERDQTYYKWVEAAMKFDELCGRERLARPPDENPAPSRNWSAGELMRQRV